MIPYVAKQNLTIIADALEADAVRTTLEEPQLPNHHPLGRLARGPRQTPRRQTVVNLGCHTAALAPAIRCLSPRVRAVHAQLTALARSGA